MSPKPPRAASATGCMAETGLQEPSTAVLQGQKLVCLIEPLAEPNMNRIKAYPRNNFGRCT